MSANPRLMIYPTRHIAATCWSDVAGLYRRAVADVGDWKGVVEVQPIADGAPVGDVQLWPIDALDTMTLFAEAAL